MKNIISIVILSLSLVLSSCGSDDGNDKTLPEELNFTGNIMGCGDFSVIKLLDPKESNISLSVSGTGRESLDLTSELKSFSFPNDNITSSISVWDAPAGANFCNDVIVEGPELISQWNAVSGTVKLSVSDIEETEFETFYRITIILENVVFENSTGNEQRRIPVLRMEAGVGWFPG